MGKEKKLACTLMSLASAIAYDSEKLLLLCGFFHSQSSCVSFSVKGAERSGSRADVLGAALSIGRLASEISDSCLLAGQLARVKV